MNEARGNRRAWRWLVLPWLAAFVAFNATADVEHAVFWAERDDANAATIDHAAWQEILDGYL